MKTPTMIYQPGDKYISDGVSYTCKVVDADEVESELKNGWFKHFNDFDQKSEKEELEEYARNKFGVELDRRKSLKKLKAEVEALEDEHRD